jgi:hypothetical protein
VYWITVVCDRVGDGMTSNSLSSFCDAISSLLYCMMNSMFYAFNDLIMNT